MKENYDLVARVGKFKTILDNLVCTSKDIFNIQDSEACIYEIAQQLITSRNNGGSVYLIGNGGSAAITSHVITDFAINCNLRTHTLHESSLITCATNDFGHEVAYTRLVRNFMLPADILIAISSSGKSPNICNAAKMAKSSGCSVITLSGFNADNTLRKLGDFNFWLNSSDYGMVEIGHLFILHNISDRIMHGLCGMQKEGKKELAEIF